MEDCHAGRAEKLQRLNLLRRAVPNTSKSSLQGILEHIAEHGLPELSNRKQMTQAAEQHLQSQSTYGPLTYEHNFIKTDGSQVAVPLVNFHSLLAASVNLNGSFYNSFKAAMQLHGSDIDKPWNLLLYSDECLPANALGRAAKKCWVVYCSFKELGRSALSHTQHWLLLAVVRTSIVATLEGHMGQVMRVIMEQIFCSTVASPLVGLLLPGPAAEQHRLFWTMGYWVQDGASQKINFGLKGDSGSNYCLKCANQITFLLNSDDASDNAVLKTVAKSELVLTTDSEALASFDRLRDRKDKVSVAEFEQWEQCTGWSYTAFGILSSQLLRPWLKPCTQYVHDYMHGMCSNGCLNIAMYLVLEHLAAEGFPSWTSMETYLALWHFPAALQKVGHLASLFTAGKVDSYRKACKVKITASEVLCIYPILQYHVQRLEIRHGSSPQRLAFLHVCRMMDLLAATQFTGTLTGQDLDQCAEAILRSFKAANWSDYCVKKFHWLLHYGDEYNVHSLLLPCWCMERKHKEITLVATRIQNLKSFEKSVLTEVLSLQLHNMEQMLKQEAALEHLSKAPQKLVAWLKQHLGLHSKEIFSSKKAVLKGGGLASVGDVVLLTNGNTWTAGKILLHFGIGLETWSLVASFKLLLYDSKTGTAKWQETDTWTCAPVLDILTPVVYTNAKEGPLTLIPFHLR